MNEEDRLSVSDQKSAEASNEEIQELIRARIENLRPKLLDLTRRNPLISTKFSPRSNSYIRVVDELPDVLWFRLDNEQKMRFLPLPRLEEDPRDEQTTEFQDALANARLTDEAYLVAMDEIDPYGENALEQNQRLERELRDRVRELLELLPRQTSTDVSLSQHARNNGISPSYELPEPIEEHGDGRHIDDDIQTLLLPNDLERKLNGLNTKCRTWIQETGINVLHSAFGFLEWTEPNGRDSSFAPLVLASVDIEKRKTREGPEFWVGRTGDEAETNMVLAEKLRLDFGIDLPKYEGGSIEEYLAEVAEASPKSLNWKVRRQVAFGVFPSARMAMYYDLDTNQNTFEQHEVVSKLLGGSTMSGSVPFADEHEVDRPEIEAKVPCLVLDADSSQFSAMVDVADGKNLAVEGPPGTGKSQTIVNTIAAAIADGKKVLFIAEKMVALDIVKSRLEAVGLGEFILPLQAGRSTRERVIASVRDRLEMTATQSAKHYDRKVEVFKQIRSDLAAYIDVISIHFGQTGFTIHDIIGKSIATNHMLLGKPKPLLSPELHDVVTYDQTRIISLRDLGAAMEGAWRTANAAKSHWRGHKILHIDRFSVDRICDLAETAANAYKTAVETRQALAALTVHPEIAPAELRSLEAVLGALPSAASINVDLIGRICREDKLKTVMSFLERCKRFQTVQQELSQIFTDAANQHWPSRLRAITKLCEDCGFDTLDTESLRSKLLEQAEFLVQQQQGYSKLKQFTEILPKAQSFGIPELIKARKLVSETPREILALRNETTAEPAAAVIMAQAGHQGRDLRRRRDELESILSTTTEISIGDLTAHLSAILGVGPLSLFSSSYRSAKRAYLSISRHGSFKKELAAKNIRALIEWKESERNFLVDHHTSAVFGRHFQGANTDFDLFDRLCAYFETVERQLSGTENREMRSFLKFGDLDHLISIPEIGEEVGQNTFDKLGGDIERAELNLSNFEHALEKMERLIVGLKEPATMRVICLKDLVQKVDTHFRLKAALDQDQEMRNFLGDRFNGASTEWNEFGTDIDAAQTIMSDQISDGVALHILEKGTIAEALPAIEMVIQRDQDAEGALRKLSQHTEIDISHFSGDRTHAEIVEYLEAASKDRDGLDVHSAYAVARRDLEGAGFDWAITVLLGEDLPLDDLGAILEAVVIRALASEVYKTHGSTLGRFRGEQLDGLRGRFAALDREIIEISRDHVRSKAFQSANPPLGNGLGRKSTWTEMALIENEISKKQRFIPVRDLTKRAGRALLELKPCWMMSPLAVAQYLTRGELNFDLCIIDEASQMPPEDSIGALARSRQAIVVGDTNQLPPTSFFRRIVDDEEADEDVSVLDESILEMANAAFRPSRRLRWHYRSRHSALIKFSNHLVYNDDLIVFPSASESRPDMGVSLVSVPGRYRSGTNGEEARAMIDAALRFMRTSPGRSLGIVTINQKQRDLLLEDMEYSLSKDRIASEYVDEWMEKKDGLEAFFIKNLENVQGDERDVIFIGTVYGPEKPGGAVAQRFGPINGLAGRRRLNVLFSRAKEQIVTFSSMTAADIRAEENGNHGVYMLKRWLEYSATGVLHTGDQTYKEPDSDFEVFVIDQIRSLGCQPVPQVGVAGYFIDIGVKHPHWPHGFIMGVECDGAAYHSSRSARDRDRLHQEVLEELGWHFYRIWSTDWFNDPRKEAEKLRQAIESRLDYLKKNATSFVPPDVEEPSTGFSQPRDELGEDIPPDTEEVRSVTASADSTPTANVLTSTARSKGTDPSYIAVGDTVRVRYLSGTESTLEVTLSEEIDVPDRSIVHVQKPLGRALLAAEEGDEIEVLVGSYVRKAVIERVTKGKTERAADEPIQDRDETRVGLTTAWTNETDGVPESQSIELQERNAKTIFATGGHPASANGPVAQVQSSRRFHESSQSPAPSDKTKLFPDRFYEPEYLDIIQAYATELIDACGPITFRHISEKIARAHGFQRTGTQIKKQVWAAISKVRRFTRAPNGETVFWPDGSELKMVIPFRGLTVAGDERSWRDVPYPEKLGLAHAIVAHGPHAEAAGAMAAQIGLGRLRQKTREELEALLTAAKTSPRAGE